MHKIWYCPFCGEILEDDKSCDVCGKQYDFIQDFGKEWITVEDKS